MNRLIHRRVGWRRRFALLLSPLALIPLLTMALLCRRAPWSADALPILIASALNAVMMFVVMIVVYRQRSRVEEAHEELLRLATTDPLTGLGNRRQLWNALDLRLERQPSRCLLLVFDLNNFKWINDSRGHADGDRVLVAFAAALRAGTRADSDCLFRTGGDEFVALLDDIEAEDGGAVAMRIFELFQVELSWRAPGVPCSASVGIAAREPGEPAGAWLHRADAAMYFAKAERLALSFAPLASPHGPRPDRRHGPRMGG